MEKDEEIILPAYTGLKRKYDYMPYTYHRIVKVLREHGMYLQDIRWYKCSRIPNYHVHYNIRSIDTDTIIRENVSLDDIRYIFARKDIPLEDSKRNPKAQAFLDAVYKLSKSTDEKE